MSRWVDADLSVHFVMPHAMKAAISSCRTCTKSGPRSARSNGTEERVIPSPGYPRPLRTPHSLSRCRLEEIGNLIASHDTLIPAGTRGNPHGTRAYPAAFIGR